MGTGKRVGGVPSLDLPEDFGTSTSWERARTEETSLSRITRAEWMVRVGDGDLYRVTFALDDGHMIGECNCKGYQYRDWCAHLAALVLDYVNDDLQPADLSTPIEEEVDILWAMAGGDGGEA